MLICPECGTRNAAGTRFCTNCGTYLEWDTAPTPGPPRDSADPRPLPPPEPRPARGPGGNGSVPRPRPAPDPPWEAESQRSRDDRGPRGPHDGTERRRITHTTDKVHKLPRDSFPDPAGGAAEDRTTVLPPVPDPVPRSRDGHRPGDPPPVRPEESRPRAPRPPEEEAETPPAPGEIVCPRCGAGNSPDRHFCRRCALDLGRGLAPPPARPVERLGVRTGLSPLAWVLIVLAALAVLLLVLSLTGASRAGGIALGHHGLAATSYLRSTPPGSGPGVEAQ